ncbi:SBBP repeat-containing protein [Acidobacteriota bacterium]
MNRKTAISIIFLLCFFFMGNILDNSIDAQSLDINATSEVSPQIDFANIPLYFIQNKGQVKKEAHFYAKASRYTLWLTKGELVFDSSRYKDEEDRAQGEKKGKTSRAYERDVSRLVFIGANPDPEIIPLEEAELRVNYFKGNDPSKWNCDIPTSKAVLYKEIYPNIDLKIYGIEKQIEYDWIIHPGGDPEEIKFEYENTKGTRIDKDGNLLIESRFGELVHKNPVSYQKMEGSCNNENGPPNKNRIPVNTEYKKIADNVYGFTIGEYDKEYDLVIDPLVLAYSTYLGGSSNDYGKGIAVDNSGNAFVTGSTSSTNYPTLNQYQAVQASDDVFVTKIDTTQSGASSLLYSSYFGGSGQDLGYGIAVDSSGNAYVTGLTSSTDYPTLNQYQTNQVGADAFMTKIDPTQSGGSSLIYSTYLGGNLAEQANGIAVDGSGNAYVTGWTSSTNYPTLNQYQTDPGDASEDVFVTKIDTTQSGGASFIYSTYLGGNSNDIGYGIAVDSSGNAYVTGYTGSANYPTWNMYQTNQLGGDAFMTKIDTTQSGAASLIYSTYLGGNSGDDGRGIAVDSSGNAYVTGYTDSSNYPIKNQYQTDQTNTDIFVTKIDATQSGTSSFIYSTYLGGNGSDVGYAIAVDSSGDAYVTGYTTSTDYPTLNQYQTDQAGTDAFVTKIDTTQSGTKSLCYSTYLGGTTLGLVRGLNGGDIDFGYGIAVDSSGNAYVTGHTTSTNFPNLNQYQADQVGDDAFLTKIYLDTAPTVTTAAVSNITTTSASSGGNVTSSGGTPVTSRGVCWSTSVNPTTADSKTSDGTGTGTFTSSITGLSPGITYYVRAYATNSGGTSYGNEVSFTTAVSTYNLTVAADAEGTTTPSPGTHTYGNNASVSVAAAANPGYRFDRWTGDVPPGSENQNPLVLTMDGDKSVTAHFKKIYFLTIIAGSGGTTEPGPGIYTYDEDAREGIYTTPQPGFVFDHWSGDVPAGSENTTPLPLIMDQDRIVTAHFKRRYTLQTSEGAGGTVTPAPGIYTYDNGTQVALDAVPKAGYRFSGWTGDVPAGLANTNPMTVTMNQDRNIKANFVLQRTLIITAGANGSTDPAPGTHTYDDGAVVTITAVPDIHYESSGWTGDVTSSSLTITVTMNSNRSVNVGFRRNIYACLVFRGEKVVNRSLTSSEYLNSLTWQANPNNSGITSYRIYEISSGGRTLLNGVSASTFQYLHRNVDGSKTYSYELVAVNNEGREGAPVTVTAR